MDQVKSILEAAGQEQLLVGADTLTADQQAAFIAQIKEIDFTYVSNIFTKSMEAPQTLQPAQPVDDVLALAGRSSEDSQRWYNAGLDEIAQGKVAILLLAGGQGTRLGSYAPKGCYDIGLPSNKSLFHLQAERVLKLQKLAAEKASGGAVTHLLKWYIMTSKATDAATQQYFVENNYFGLKPEQVGFFQQGMLPALTPEGKIVLEAPGKPAMAPDGNGGLYMGLSNAGILRDMAQNGIEALECYCVDNALARLGDPTFIGYCRERNAQVGARVVARAGPEEKVGVFARRGSGLEVVEYSEMDPEEASAVNPDTGILRYNWANICMHYFERTWLESVAGSLAQGGRYHIAKKQIPSVDGKVSGIKLELFIFDTFPSAERTALWEVKRDEEFAPVKNAPGSATDSPDTARAAVLALHKRWVEAAGGTVGPEGVEVSPLVSYNGEGLEGLVAGQSFLATKDDRLQSV